MRRSRRPIFCPGFCPVDWVAKDLKWKRRCGQIKLLSETHHKSENGHFLASSHHAQGYGKPFRREWDRMLDRVSRGGKPPLAM